MVAWGLESVRSENIIDLAARRALSPTPVVSIRDRVVRQWTVVTVEGEMDIQAVAMLSEMEDRIGTHVVFCLRDVSFMDAAALGALTKLRHQTLSRGGCLRLVAPSAPVLRLLLLTGMGSAFATYYRVSDALVAPVAPDRSALPARSLPPA